MRSSWALLAPVALIGLPSLAPVSGTTGDPVPGSASFTLDVEPWLQKQGCASAYCHGSATGQKGFKLSLFGSDPRADWEAIAQDLGGRRVDLVHAEQSLVLQKPSSALRHGGGKKLPRGSEAYDALSRWVADGARFDEGTRVDALRLVPGDAGYRALATTEGKERDVTAMALWSSTDETVATVDGSGRVHRLSPGRTLVVARYAGAEATLADARPFCDGRQLGDAVQLGDAAPGGLGLVAAPDAPPWRIARRLWLDLAGRLPSPAEDEGFTARPQQVRIAEAARELVAKPEFDAVFAGHLAAWLEIPAGDARTLVRLPLEQLVRRLLALRSYLDKREDPRDRAELFARSLLGIRIGCARCHDHPLDRWRQGQHLAFSACFASPRPAPGGGMREGILFDPGSGAPVTPRLLPLRGPQSGPPQSTSPTQPLADWTLETAAGELRRNFGNRVLALLLGRGPVDPVDDHRPSNPPSEPELLERMTALATDLPALATAVATSPEYRRDSTPDAGKDHGDARVRHFARREARELEPRLLVRAIASALQKPLTVELPGEPLARELALLNGSWLPDAVAGSDLAAAGLEEIYVRVLSRPPSDAERKALAAEDPASLACALFRSREFRSLR